ncbi:MAG: heavy metal-associated domain-containing protein [bacterium]|nr:heavy metal-associated domain-containing protein [bacterium]
MQKATIQLETLTCPSCVLKIESAVKGLEGVDKDSLQVLFNASRVKVDFHQEKVSVQDVETAISKLGYQVKKSTVK